MLHGKKDARQPLLLLNNCIKAESPFPAAFFKKGRPGYLKKGDMHNIVTSGVGIFGPNMRVGTIAEICSVTVKFKGDE